MEKSDFHYVPSAVGTISGASVLRQTEDAINDLGTQFVDINESATEALTAVKRAQETADKGLSVAQNAQATATANEQKINTINGTLATLNNRVTEVNDSLTTQINELKVQGDDTWELANKAILYEAQTLTDEQKAQARQNISAAGTNSPTFTGNVSIENLTVAGTLDGTAAAAYADGFGNNIADTYATKEDTILTGSATAENLALSGTLGVEGETTLTGPLTVNGAATLTEVSAATVTATGGFVGNLTGTASRATADAAGNVITSTYATKSDTYTKAEVDAKVTSVYRIKGSVPSYDSLPTSGQVSGDVWNIEDTGANYVWTGSAWDKLSETIDLTPYLTKAEAATTYLEKTENAASASQLATARNITATGDASWSVSFNGTQDASGALTLTSTGVTAGSYGPDADVSPAFGDTFKVPYVTVDAKGRVTGAAIRTITMPMATVASVSGLSAELAKKLNLAGGTMTGDLILNADPTQAMGAATKQYVDNVISTGSGDAVLYTAQTLNDTQKAQARTNIGAISAAEVPAPDLSSYLTKTEAQNTYLGKNAKATSASSADAVPWSGVSDKPTFATVATSGSYNDLSDKPTIPDTSVLVPKSGGRGSLAGHMSAQVQSTALTVSASTRDSCCITGSVAITVDNGAENTAWTKTVSLTNASATVSLGSSWKWLGGEAPTVKANCVLVLHWCHNFGIANLAPTTA